HQAPQQPAPGGGILWKRRGLFPVLGHLRQKNRNQSLHLLPLVHGICLLCIHASPIISSGGASVKRIPGPAAEKAPGRFPGTLFLSFAAPAFSRVPSAGTGPLAGCRRLRPAPR